MRLPNGRTYTTTVSAKSVYHAAALFHEHCNNGPPEMKRPTVDPKAMLEVKPIYSVQSSEVIAWVAEQSSRESRKRRRER